MRRALRAAMICGLLIPASLLAQDPDFVARLDERTTQIVVPILEDAARDSLPMRALESKVLEGLTKRVPAERLGPVVAQLAGEFRAVRGSLRGLIPGVPLSDPEVVASARAVREGVTVELIADVLGERGPEQALDVPITVLGELVRRGVPANDAALVIGHVVQTGIPVDVAARIPGTLDGALGRGGTPGAALAEALRTLDIPTPRGKGPGR